MRGDCEMGMGGWRGENGKSPKRLDDLGMLGLSMDSAFMVKLCLYIT